MLTKSVKSVISVALKHVTKKSVRSVRSVSSNIRIVLPICYIIKPYAGGAVKRAPLTEKPVTGGRKNRCGRQRFSSDKRKFLPPATVSPSRLRPCAAQRHPHRCLRFQSDMPPTYQGNATRHAQMPEVSKQSPMLHK